MKRIYKDMSTSNELLVNEPAIAYQRISSEQGVTRKTTHKDLETECFSLEESKKRLVKKIHRHYHPHS